MMDVEAIYAHLPRFAQNLACSFEGLRIQKKRYGRPFLTLLQEVESHDTWSQDQIEEYRDQHVREYVRHCAKTVPYFRARFQELGITYTDIHTLADLCKLPVIGKAEMASQMSSFQSKDVHRKKCIVSHTSGTTGSGLRFCVTPRANWMQWAVTWRYRRWHGINLDTKCAFFGGRSIVPISQRCPPYWRYDHVRHQILFSGYHISPETMPLYVDELRRQKPPWICGYPSLITLIASFIVDSKSDLGYYPRWVTTLSENLLAQQRAVITAAFGVAPRQHYGMTEGAVNMGECEQGRLHVDEDFSAVELVDDAGIVGARVVGTAFHNPATAFLRYEVGDRATLSTERSCPCGRPGRLIEVIDGRREDYVILRNGSRVGRMDHVFKDLVNVREAQIYQKNPGEITVRIVRGSAYSLSDEEKLRQELQKRLGKETLTYLEYCDALLRGKSGKLRFVVSELDRGKIAGSSDASDADESRGYSH